MKEKQQTEKVPLFMVYTQNGQIKTEVTEDQNDNFQLYGFLKCFIKHMEEGLLSDIQPRED